MRVLAIVLIALALQSCAIGASHLLGSLPPADLQSQNRRSVALLTAATVVCSALTLLAAGFAGWLL
ncbi:hypothetical protein J8J40_32970 [Mycobacterium tuberculosis]|nr:hypothetical protein [Mycobacterium tuberculosis]